MKTLFLFNDTETTGITKKENKLFSPYYKEQNLTYALVLCEKDQVLLEEEIKIKLKNNVLPNAGALLVNNINPFDPEFSSKAVSEYEGAHYFANKILEYKNQGYRILFIAYNAEYDESLMSDMLKRSGIEFHALIDCVFDPLFMTRSLVKSKDIKTREISNYGKTYNSASLEDVYNGLGYSSSAITAHNALEDTKMLKTVVYKAYYLFTGKSFDEMEIDASTFAAGAEKTIGVVEDMELKIKTIKVLKTNKTGKILALDFSKIQEHPDKVKACVVEIKLNNVLDEYDLKIKESNEVESFYNKYQSTIDDLVSKNELTDSVYATHEVLYFGAVEKLAEKLKQDPKANLDEKELEILELAEEYSYARYNEGWSIKNKGPNYENQPAIHPVQDGVDLHLDPVGSFYLIKGEEVLLKSEKKTEVLAYLTTKMNVIAGSDLYKKINALLVPVKTFKNPKLPHDLIKEFNDKKTLVFNGSNKLHKDILRDLKEFYQKVNPEAFRDLTIPDFKLNLNIFKKG